MKEIKVGQNNYIKMIQNMREGCSDSYVRYCFENVIFTDEVDIRPCGVYSPLHLSFQNCTFLNRSNHIKAEEVQIEGCRFKNFDSRVSSRINIHIDAKDIVFKNNNVEKDKIYLQLDKDKHPVLEGNIFYAKSIWVSTNTMPMASLLQELSMKNQALAETFVLKDMKMVNPKVTSLTNGVRYDADAKKWWFSNVKFMNAFSLCLGEKDQVVFKDCTFNPVGTPNGPIAQTSAGSISIEGKTKVVRQDQPNTHLYFVASQIELSGKAQIDSFICFDADEMMVCDSSINASAVKIRFGGKKHTFQNCLIDTYLAEFDGNNRFEDSICRAKTGMEFTREKPLVWNSNLLCRGYVALPNQILSDKNTNDLEDPATLAYARRHLLETLTSVRDVVEESKEAKMKQYETYLQHSSLEKILKK